ncbi:bifunctional oligoribonuclease/PAP phosphatase NrnA [bacterium]|nr:bifunctional oligoribonuclease/PAP phosphatase NrnA [bacterium]
MNSEKVAELIKNRIRSKERFIVASHIDPDGDAVGSLLAMVRFLANIGKTVSGYLPSGIPKRYEFLADEDSVLQKVPKGDFDVAVILDCSSLDRLDLPFIRFLNRKNVERIVIDHHNSKDPFGDISLVCDGVSSTGEILLSLFEQLSPSAITPGVASPLYTALLTDTGNFSFPNTSAETLESAAKLVRYGAQPSYISTKIYDELPVEYLKNIGVAFHNMEFFPELGIMFVSLPQDEVKQFDPSFVFTEGVVDFTLKARGVKIGVLFKQVDSNFTRISLRSVESVDVGQFANSLGGGGHKNAAGISLSLSLEESKRFLLRRLKKLL